MAVTSPVPDPSRSPGCDSPDSAAERARPNIGTPPDPHDERTLDLALIRAMIEDGVLMVLGPDGDPVPPQSFGAAAAERPDALVPLTDGPRVRADRIAAVLDAQRSGRLGSGQGGDAAWIPAMLGIGPRLETASEEDLRAERHSVEVVAFGKEMMITSPSGGTFLLAEARAPSPASVRLLDANGQALALGAVVASLLGRADPPGAGTMRAKMNERAFLDCRTWLEDDALVVDLPEVGALHFSKHDPAAGRGPSISAFMPDGDTATLDQLIDGLSRSLISPQAHVLQREQHDPTITESPGADPGTASEPAASAASRRLSLAVRLPEELDEIALVLVRRVPAGAVLSAGVACDDGSWLLSPRDLAGLSLTPPSGWPGDLSLEVVAIAVRNRDGELASRSNAMAVPVPAASDRVASPIPVALDPRVLSGETPLDALIVRDLPTGATLSAGAYDPAIDGWVLLPRQAGALTVTPGIRQTEDFTLTVLGVRLADGGGRPRPLARISIAIRQT